MDHVLGDRFVESGLIESRGDLCGNETVDVGRVIPRTVQPKEGVRVRQTALLPLNHLQPWSVGERGPGNEPRADLDMATILTKLATFEILQHGLVLQVEHASDRIWAISPILHGAALRIFEQFILNLLPRRIGGEGHKQGRLPQFAGDCH